MNSQKMPVTQIFTVLIGEAIVSALAVLVYILIGKYDYTVLLGALLGTAVIMLNFIFLCISVNRAIDRVLEDRGDREMSDEEAAEFAKAHQGKLQATAQISQVVRMLSMLAVIAVALFTDHFNVITTVIPLVAFTPILMLGELFGGKRRK